MTGDKVEPKKFKKCGRCGVLQLSSNFSVTKRFRDGLAQMCKTCDSARMKAAYARKKTQ